MKKVYWLLVILMLVTICMGCDKRVVNIEKSYNILTENSGQSPSKQDSEIPSSAIIPTVNNGEEQFIFTIKDRTIGFSFDMHLSEAQKVLDNAGLEYRVTDDCSKIRSWAGYRICMNGIWFTFDIEKKLHEINFSPEEIKTNIPIKIGDLVSDMTEEYGKTEEFDSPSHPRGAVAVLSCEYELNGYYVRPVYGGERILYEEFSVWEINVSKYSKKMYEENPNPAKLIFTNKMGEKADFYIGMTREDAVSTLRQLGISFRESENVCNLISGDVILGAGPTHDNDAFEGYCYDIYFDMNDRICTVNSLGSGVFTSMGLKAQDPLNGGGDDRDAMTKLHGDVYYERPMSNKNYHVYRYVEDNQYLYVCIDNSVGDSEAIIGFYISRYTGTRPFESVY